MQRFLSRFFPISLLAVISLIAILLSLGTFESLRDTETEPRVIEMTAYQFGFEPHKVTIRAGDKVVFKVVSQDVTHGFLIDGTDIKETLEPFKPVTIGPISFDKPGKLKIRCANFCGPLHPFMVADLVIHSTSIPLFPALIGLAFLVVLGMMIYLWKYVPDDTLLGVSLKKEVDVLRTRFVGPLLNKFLKWRPSHFWIVLPNLWIILIIFTASVVGNPLGALNFSIAIIWILWFCLVEFMIFFGGRLWCLMCPLPFFGDWIARRRIALGRRVPNRWLSLNLKWPKWLDNSWVASIGFLCMSLPVPWLVTRPSITGILFMGMLAVATMIPLIFEGGRRRFCDNLCPAFYIGYHASTSALAIAPRDEEICKKHQCKECLFGNSRGYGCPWGSYPGGKGPTGSFSSIHCNLCHECVKACSLNNMTLKLRMPAKEVIDKVRSRADEAWQGFIRLSLAVFYEFVFFGSFFWIKDWGNMSVFQGSNMLTLGVMAPSAGAFINWLKWCLLVASVSLVILPAVFFGFSYVSNRFNKATKKPPLTKTFLALSYSISPYGQLLWMSFGLSLLMVNWAYPFKAFLSDPLGWGWNYSALGGAFAESAHGLFSPFMAEYLPIIQYVFCIFALAFAVQTTYALSLKLFNNEKTAAIRTTGVMSGFYFLTTVGFMWVFLG